MLLNVIFNVNECQKIQKYFSNDKSIILYKNDHLEKILEFKDYAFLIVFKKKII